MLPAPPPLYSSTPAHTLVCTVFRLYLLLSYEWQSDNEKILLYTAPVDDLPKIFQKKAFGGEQNISGLSYLKSKNRSDFFSD
ncbi:hypothetical protein PV325_006212 [Microctonus aethiopoides]|nr:hypothetical protein PV325_006212 [Microctonus aethiopoides]